MECITGQVSTHSASKHQAAAGDLRGIAQECAFREGEVKVGKETAAQISVIIDKVARFDGDRRT